MTEESKPKRLCSEIQLFDLCSKDTCTCRDGRYCSNSEMLAKFEAISEEDEKDLNLLVDDEDGELENSEYEFDDDRFGVYDNENEDEDEDEDEDEGE